MTVRNFKKPLSYPQECKHMPGQERPETGKGTSHFNCDWTWVHGQPGSKLQICLANWSLKACLLTESSLATKTRQIRLDQLLSRVRLIATPWIAASQASLSITNSQSSLRFMSIKSVMPSSHFILCRPLLFLPPIPPSIRVFSNKSTLCMRWPCEELEFQLQSIGVSASASVLPMNTQDWSPLGWTGWISWQSKGLSRVFSNTTVQKHQFFGAQPSSQSNSHIHTWPREKP